MEPWPLIVAALKAPFMRLPGWLVGAISTAFVFSGLCILAYLIGYVFGLDEGRQVRENRDSAGEAWRLVILLEPLRQGNTREAIAGMEYRLKRAILRHADFLEGNRDSLPAADEVAMSKVVLYVKAYPWADHELTKRYPEDEQRIRDVLDRYDDRRPEKR